MTITKRVSGSVAEDISKRIDGTASIDVTARVSGAIADGSSKRVASNGATPDSFSDPWNGSWGNSWGNSWRIVTHGVGASPAIDVTQRVTSAVTASNTKRVTGI